MNTKLNLKRTVKILWHSGQTWAIANVVLLIIQGVIPVLALYLIKLIIDAVTAGVNAPDQVAAFG